MDDRVKFIRDLIFKTARKNSPSGKKASVSAWYEYVRGLILKSENISEADERLLLIELKKEALKRLKSAKDAGELSPADKRLAVFLTEKI
ncbi:MAG: hypothetical protein ACOX68_08785 [Candidatus Limivicinus sp.]